MREMVRHIRQAQCRQAHHERNLNSPGFTLIEMLVALAVGAVILTGSVMGIFQIMVSTGRANNQVVSLTDINRAALAIKNDLMMALTTDFVDGEPQSSANLSWFDYTSSFGTSFQTDYSVSYSLSNKQLRRNYNGAVSIVGRNITSISFTQSTVTQSGDPVRSVSVALSSSNTTAPSGIETLTFSVHLRPQVIN